MELLGLHIHPVISVPPVSQQHYYLEKKKNDLWLKICVKRALDNQSVVFTH